MPQISAPERSLRSTARKSTGTPASTPKDRENVKNKSSLDSSASRNVKVTARKSTGSRLSNSDDSSASRNKESMTAVSMPEKSLRSTAKKSTGTRTFLANELDTSTEKESMTALSAPSTARKSTGTRTILYSEKEVIPQGTRTSARNSPRNQQASTSYADSAFLSNDSDSDSEITPQRSRISTRKSSRNKRTSTSLASSAGPSNDSDVSDVDSIAATAPLRSSRRIKAQQNNSVSNQNSLNALQATTSSKSNTSHSEDSDSSNDNNSRRQQTLPRASQRKSKQNVPNEENISDYSSETPDSDGIPVHDRNVTKRKRTAPSKKLPTRRKRKGSSDFSEEENVGSIQKQSKNQGHQMKSGTGSKAPTAKVKIDSVNSSTLKNLAQKCAYFLLVEDQKKYAIRKKSIVAHVFKDQAYSSKVYNLVLKEANTVLKKTYGLELIQLENQKDSYLIVNTLERELGIEDFFDFSRLKQQQYGLLLFLLTVIFMNENSINEADLWKALKPLGIDPSCQQQHPVFGDVKKYITSELVKQMYLDYKTINSETGEREFLWGVRAKAEVDKRDLLEFACEVLDVSSPKAFIIQYNDAQASAEADNNTNEV